MVLIRGPRWPGVLAALMLGGCSQSLFDAQSGGGGGDDDGMTPVPTSCQRPCLADAASDFDGTAGGTGGHWRYLDDHRDRTWTAMTPSGGTMLGADPSNRISSCAASPESAACKALPGALLVSTSGATSAADPALEVTSPTQQVLQLAVRAFVPAGDDQAIRVYRNSREDVLFTGKATAGKIFEQAITLDALAGDRFLVAVAPSARGTGDVGLQVFASPTGARFPARCQVAISFPSATSSTVENQCGAAFTHLLYDPDMPSAGVVGPGPFPELGSAADFAFNNYLRGPATLDRTHDTTTQLWVKLRKFDDLLDNAWPFSDLDLNNTGGLGVALLNMDPPQIDVVTCTSPAPEFTEMVTSYPGDGGWHFVRVVQAGDTVKLCVDGKFLTSIPVAAGKLASTFRPHIGANAVWSPQGAFFDGQIDDVRVLTDALPCE
ncbi:MAG TPA: LamG-like jellyroll fold domain-containing protein [Kofleriaceae bacterium]|nr:LamG-like jellyroll fold domain-containing protein [Kofleriaceae bacterium]